MESNYKESSELIYKDLDIDLKEEINADDKIIEVIADRVRYLLDHDINLLMSYLYRLDVLEVNIDAALKSNTLGPPDIALARLIMERQIQRIATKKKYKVEPIDEWED